MHLKCTNLTIKEFISLDNPDMPYVCSGCYVDIFPFQNLSDNKSKDYFFAKNKSQIGKIISTNNYETDQPNYYLTPTEFKNKCS